MLRSVLSMSLALAALAMGRSATDSSGINWLDSLGTKCTGNFTQLDRFAEGSYQNAQGGYWYTFTDSVYAGKSGGISAIKNDSSTNEQGIEFLPNDGSGLPHLAGITATLNKGDASAHPYGGWAVLGTGFSESAGNNIAITMSGLKAISFYIQLDANFDVENLTGVNFKVENHPALVGDSVRFHAGIQPSLANGKEICIDVEQFKQPDWHKTPMSTMPLVISHFLWEIKINADSKISAAPSSFSIGNVRLWGLELPLQGECLLRSGKFGCAEWGPSLPRTDLSATPSDLASDPNSATAASRQTLTARYSNALLLSYALDGAPSAKIQILRLDGSKVAAFDGAAKATNQSFSANLARGTYLAVVQGGSHKLVAPFAVTR